MSIILQELVDVDILYRLIHSKKLIKWDNEQKEKLLATKQAKAKPAREIDNILAIELEQQHINNSSKERDPQYYFTIKPIKQYMTSIDKNNNTVSIIYKVNGYGRFTNTTISGIPYSYTNMFHEIRNLSAYKFVYDIDIKNCHVSLIINICNLLHIKCTELKAFAKNRDKYITTILDKSSNKTNKKDIKAFLNKILYKWETNPTTNTTIGSSFNKIFGYQAPSWLIKLKQEMKNITLSIINNPKYVEIYKWKIQQLNSQYPPVSGTQTIYNKEGKILSIIIQDFERQILEHLYKIISDDNIIVRSLIHDGMHIDKQNISLEQLSIYLNKWITNVNLHFNFSYPLELINKPMDIDESFLETTIEFTNYYYHKQEFEKKYFKIKNPLMYRYNTSYTTSYNTSSIKAPIHEMPNDEHNTQQISEFYSYDRFMKHDELIKAEQDHQYPQFITKWLDDPYKRQYETLLFYPYNGSKSPLSPNVYNTFDGFSIIPHIKSIHQYQNLQLLSEQLQQQLRIEFADKSAILLNHLKKLGKDEQGYNFLCNWIAHIFQYPNKKTECCIVLKGKQGKGKNTLFNILKAIIGEKYCVETANIDHIYGKFAGCRADKLLVLLDEVEFRNTKEELGKIKTSITTDNFILEKKGIDGITYKSFENYIFASNNDLCIPIEESNRRFFVIDVNSINYGTDDEKKSYFNNIYHIIGNKASNIIPQYDILTAFYNYMLLIPDIQAYNFEKAITKYSKDARDITTKNPVDLFLEHLLYKEAENDFRETKYTKELGFGIRIKPINGISTLQAIYKQSYLFKEYNIYYKSISNKENTMHNNMFSRELTRDRDYITDIKTEGYNMIIIDIEKWKNAFNFIQNIHEEQEIIDF